MRLRIIVDVDDNIAFNDDGTAWAVQLKVVQ